MKRWFRILDIGPSFQVSQCAIYQWRRFSPGPSGLAELAIAKLAEVNVFCKPAD